MLLFFQINQIFLPIWRTKFSPTENVGAHTSENAYCIYHSIGEEENRACYSNILNDLTQQLYEDINQHWAIIECKDYDGIPSARIIELSKNYMQQFLQREKLMD